MASVPVLIESRRIARDIVSFHAPLDGAPGNRATVLVVDISPLGFMARTGTALAREDAVTVTLPVIGRRAARIIWSLAGRAGAEFDEAIDPSSYARMLAGAPHDRPACNEF